MEHGQPQGLLAAHQVLHDTSIKGMHYCGCL